MQALLASAAVESTLQQAPSVGGAGQGTDPPSSAVAEVDGGPVATRAGPFQRSSPGLETSGDGGQPEEHRPPR